MTADSRAVKPRVVRQSEEAMWLGCIGLECPRTEFSSVSRCSRVGVEVVSGEAAQAQAPAGPQSLASCSLPATRKGGLWFLLPTTLPKQPVVIEPGPPILADSPWNRPSCAPSAYWSRLPFACIGVLACRLRRLRQVPASTAALRLTHNRRPQATH